MPRRIERTIDHARSLAVAVLQIRIPRGKRQAIGLANDRADHDARVEVQIARHLTDDSQLLRVLAPQESESRLNNFKKLQNHRGNAAKMAGACAPFQPVAQSLHDNRGTKIPRIDFLGRRRE